MSFRLGLWRSEAEVLLSLRFTQRKAETLGERKMRLLTLVGRWMPLNMAGHTTSRGAFHLLIAVRFLLFVGVFTNGVSGIFSFWHLPISPPAGSRANDKYEHSRRFIELVGGSILDIRPASFLVFSRYPLFVFRFHFLVSFLRTCFLNVSLFCFSLFVHTLLSFSILREDRVE